MGSSFSHACSASGLHKDIEGFHHPIDKIPVPLVQQSSRTAKELIHGPLESVLIGDT